MTLLFIEPDARRGNERSVKNHRCAQHNNRKSKFRDLTGGQHWQTLPVPLRHAGGVMPVKHSQVTHKACIGSVKKSPLLYRIQAALCQGTPLKMLNFYDSSMSDSV